MIKKMRLIDYPPFILLALLAVTQLMPSLETIGYYTLIPLIILIFISVIASFRRR